MACGNPKHARLEDENALLIERVALLAQALHKYSSEEYRQRSGFMDSTPVYRWSLHKGSGWHYYDAPPNGKPWDAADAALAALIPHKPRPQGEKS